MHTSPDIKAHKLEVYDPTDINSRLAGVAILAEMLHDANPDVAVGGLDSKD